LTRATKGIALIPVLGSLINRGAWLDSRSGLTAYEGLDAQFKEAGSDPEIHSIVIDMDTPGGEAGGMFKLVSTIRQVGRSKRIVAVVDDMAASAGYGIASAAHEIVVSPTSVVGSIGVVMIHLDRSGQLAEAGVKPTLIFAGRHKVDGHPFGPLPPEVIADKQRQIGVIYGQFIDVVAAGRGARTTAQRARETEARVFIGADAVKAGLADRIGSLDQVITELSSRKPGRGAPSGAHAVASGDQKIAAGWRKALAQASAKYGVTDEQRPPPVLSKGWAAAIRRANGETQ
jgi:signal peptide peptidase SppA